MERRLTLGRLDPPSSRTAGRRGAFNPLRPPLGKHPANASSTTRTGDRTGTRPAPPAGPALRAPTAVSSANGAAADRDSRTHACGYGTGSACVSRPYPARTSGSRWPAAVAASTSAWATVRASSCSPYRASPSVISALSCGHTEPRWYDNGWYAAWSAASVRTPQPEKKSGSSRRRPTISPYSLSSSPDQSRCPASEASASTWRPSPSNASAGKPCSGIQKSRWKRSRRSPAACSSSAAYTSSPHTVRASWAVRRSASYAYPCAPAAVTAPVARLPSAEQIAPGSPSSSGWRGRPRRRGRRDSRGR